MTGDGYGEYPDDYISKWYDEKEDKFNISVYEVKEVLNKYFESVNFNPEEIDGYKI